MDGRGDAGSEHGQGTATLSEPGRRQEPETSAERQGQWLVGECHQRYRNVISCKMLV